MKVEKLRGVVDRAGECGDTKVERVEKNRRSLVTLSVKRDKTVSE